MSDKTVRVFLRDRFEGHITAPNEDGTFEVLKVFPYTHEKTGILLCYFCVASPYQRQALFNGGYACTQNEAVGLVVSLSQGSSPMPTQKPEHVPESHFQVEQDWEDDEDGFSNLPEEKNPETRPVAGKPVGPAASGNGNSVSAEDKSAFETVAVDDDTPLSKIRDISALMRKCLAAGGVETMGDLRETTAADLKKIKGVGSMSARNLARVAKEYAPRKSETAAATV